MAILHAGRQRLTTAAPPLQAAGLHRELTLRTFYYGMCPPVFSGLCSFESRKFQLMLTHRSLCLPCSDRGSGGSHDHLHAPLKDAAINYQSTVHYDAMNSFGRKCNNGPVLSTQAHTAGQACMNCLGGLTHCLDGAQLAQTPPQQLHSHQCRLTPSLRAA